MRKQMRDDLKKKVLFRIIGSENKPTNPINQKTRLLKSILPPSNSKERRRKREITKEPLEK